MPYHRPNWKENWEEAKQHYVQWWKREGPVLTMAGLPLLNVPRDNAEPPREEKDARERNTNPEWFAQGQRARLARQPFPADNLPIAHVDYGCVQLAACLGAEPHFDDETVWYNDCIDAPEASPPLILTKAEKWWNIYKSILLRLEAISQGDYLIGGPAFGSNLDVLAELRGTQNLLYDLIERPGWVKDRLEEINDAFFIAFDDYYHHIQLTDGSSAFAYFQLWGPGKTSQVQCDFAAMISPGMFKEFVLPPLQRQCAWLDHSMFHLDGPNCICHLDHLLSIEPLDAVQWSPGAGQPGPGDPKWYGLYERVLNGGKSLQILGISPEEARRIFDRFGSRGIYLSVQVTSEREALDMMALRQTI